MKSNLSVLTGPPGSPVIWAVAPPGERRSRALSAQGSWPTEAGAQAIATAAALAVDALVAVLAERALSYARPEEPGGYEDETALSVVRVRWDVGARVHALRVQLRGDEALGRPEAIGYAPSRNDATRLAVALQHALETAYRPHRTPMK